MAECVASVRLELHTPGLPLRTVSTVRATISVQGGVLSVRGGKSNFTFPLRPPLAIAAARAAAGMLGVTLRGVRLHPPACTESAVSVLIRGAPPAACLALRDALAAAVGARPAALAPRPSSADNKRVAAPAGAAPVTKRAKHAAPARATPHPHPATAAGFARAAYSPNAPSPPAVPTVAAYSNAGGPRLTPEQAAIVAAVVDRGESLFFTGPAGCGKSAVLRAVIAALPPAPATAVVAPTGLAAAALGGVTLHSFAGVGPDALIAGPAAAVAALRRAPAALAARWRALRTLVVDEVSMLDAATFDALDALARAARNRPNAPFGGVQLVLSGCFFQLPPVRAVGGRAFRAAGWGPALHACVELTTVHRQSRDPRFADVLCRVRVGAATRADVAWLTQTCARPLPRSSPDAPPPTRLLTHRSAVDAVNEREVDDLEGGEEVVFEATDDGDPAALDAGTRAPRRLRLKPGAAVMLTRNATSVDARLVNGARGVVVGFEKAATGGGVAPVVRFAAGGRPRALPRVSHTLAGGGGRRFQVPLAHAAALSIHKAQGMTLDAVEVDVGAAFEAGMAYVALSRATTAAGLRLLGALTLDALAPDPDVVEFYQGLENSAQRAKEGGGGAAAAAAAVAPPARGAVSPVGGGLRIKF